MDIASRNDQLIILHMKISLLLPILYYFTFSPNVVQSQSKFLEKQKQTQNEKIEKWIEM